MLGSGVCNVYVDDPLAPYAVNNFLDGTPMYIGKVSADGRLLVLSYNSTTGVMQYANVSNNAAYTTYATAWAARASLTYAAYGVITGV